MSFWSRDEQPANEEQLTREENNEQSPLDELTEEMDIARKIEDQALKFALEAIAYRKDAVGKKKVKDMDATELLLMSISSSLIANTSRAHAQKIRQGIKDEVMVKTLKKSMDKS